MRFWLKVGALVLAWRWLAAIGRLKAGGDEGDVEWVEDEFGTGSKLTD